MDEQGRAIGRRVHYWRLRRNLGHKHFADMVGRSTSWLDKIETGERSLLRLPMLERVAECLGVDPSALTEEPAASRAAQCVDASEVRAIRAALGTYPELAADDTERPLSVPKLSRQSEYLDLAWTTSRFTLVARYLPSVIRDAQQATVTAGADTRLTAHRVLVNSYRLASSVLLKFEANQVAWLAADRAMRTALGTSYTWAMARATRSVARAMTSSGQRQEALTALINMSDRMRPELAARADGLLTIYGMLFLAASITAAKEENAELADQMHREATAAEARLQPEHRTHNTFFGPTNALFDPTNVAIHRVGALVRLHEGGRALEFAATIAPDSIAGLPPERRANYLLDLTEAHTSVGDYRNGVRSLVEAEQIAPEEVHCRPLAHGLLRSLLKNTTGEPARTVRQLADRAGVTA